MNEEYNLDIENDNIYLSTRFNENGISLYPKLMLNAIKNGNEVSLADTFRQNRCFKETEEYAKGYRKVPATAPDTYAEGEFNRYYIRALCLLAIKANSDLEVYRAKEVSNPRSASTEMIGTRVDPHELLSDLRVNIGVDTVLGLPAGPNSGLSVKLVS